MEIQSVHEIAIQDASYVCFGKVVSLSYVPRSYFKSRILAKKKTPNFPKAFGMWHFMQDFSPCVISE